MENLNLTSKDFKMYKLSSLEPGDILIVTIPSKDFMKGFDKVKTFTRNIHELLIQKGMENLLFVVPDDMFFGKVSTKDVLKPEEIEPEMDLFDEVDFKL